MTQNTQIQINSMVRKIRVKRIAHKLNEMMTLYRLLQHEKFHQAAHQWGLEIDAVLQEIDPVDLVVIKSDKY